MRADRSVLVAWRAFVFAALTTLATKKAWADSSTTPSNAPSTAPTTAPSSETMQASRVELEVGERAVAAGDCVTMCKALHSMARAAQRICVLAEGGSEADRARCTEAKSRVDEATKRVLAACPACDPSPPYAPALPPSPPPPHDEVSEESSTFASPTVATSGSDSYLMRSVDRRWLTLSLSLPPLFLPPSTVRIEAEGKLVDHLSLALSGGVGRLATKSDAGLASNDLSGSGASHETTISLGVALRGYLVRGFSGLYVAADLRFAHVARPALDDSSHLTTRAITPGLMLGPMLGYKLVARGGLTLDTSVGLGVVVVDRRRAGEGTDRLVPTWDVTIGYSF